MIDYAAAIPIIRRIGDEAIGRKDWSAALAASFAHGQLECAANGGVLTLAAQEQIRSLVAIVDLAADLETL